MPEGGLRFQLTEFVGSNGRTGLMIHDNTSEAAWHVTLVPHGEDIITFDDEELARGFINRQGFIVLTSSLKNALDNGLDIFKMYGGRSLAEWIAEGARNREHVHPDEPAQDAPDEEKEAFVEAYIVTMSGDEMMRALGLLAGRDPMETLLGGAMSPLDEMLNPFSGLL
jgi:hypothetical protein